VNLIPEEKLQVPPLRFAPVGMTKLRVAAHLCSSGGGWTDSAQQLWYPTQAKIWLEWGTRRFSLVDSVDPPPPLPRWTAALNFVIPTGAKRRGATVCFVKRFGVVVEKTWTESTWETRLRFPLSPNAAAAGVFLRRQNSSRWRLSQLLQHVPSFCIESHQEFVSQSDANHFLGFAGRS
jgi:hypothetical protein